MGSDGEQTTSVVGREGEGEGISHQSAHVIIITCFSQLDRVSRRAIFLP